MAMIIPSITARGIHEPFNLQVARNQIYKHKSIYKFGFNPDVNGSLETIWDQGGLYVYPTSAIQMKVSSTSADDTSAGTGARTIVVYGLDENYNEAEETVTLNGQTEVLTTTTFIRVFRASVTTAGSGNTAAGNIYIGTGTVTTGVPATVYAKITLGENQTLMALWTVPAGYTAYLLRDSFSVGTASPNQYVTGKLVQRPFNEVFKTAQKITIVNGFLDQEYLIPVSFTEKTDIEARAFSSGTSNAVASTFNMIYIKNEDT